MIQKSLIVFVAAATLKIANVESFSPSTKIVPATSSLQMESDIIADGPMVEGSAGSLVMEEPKVTVSELPKMSQSLPFMERPPMLTGALAGDVGFDPLGFAKTNEDLMNYREAEIKHARLAMLAAAGWPLSEVLDKKVAGILGWAPILDGSDRVPSLLNGGLGKVSPFYWVGCIAVAAAVDVYGITRKNAAGGNQDYIPGDLGLDFFGLYPANDKNGQKRMQLAELKNGRLAMIAIFAFAIQEAVTKVAVINETPLFFFPLGETLRNYANSGYIQ